MEKICKLAWIMALAAGLGTGVLWSQGIGGLTPGSYSGNLELPGTKLPLIINLSLKDGALAATMDSPSQGAKGIPATGVSLKDSWLVVTFKSLGASFEAKVSADSSTLTGSWIQGGARLPLTLARGAQLAGPSRPQTPKPPYPYATEEVVLPGGAPGVSLAGTLSLPPGQGPFPAVILITGSGPQDRDETILGHKPFLVIADYLARRGIASLRLDDRGVGASTGDFSAATTLDFASDARAALVWLAARPGIDPRRVGLVGHSEGGIIAPLVARAEDKVAFVVLLAGPGLPGRDLLLLQSAAIMRAAGAKEDAIAATGKLNGELYDLAIGGLSETDKASRIKEAYLSWVNAQGGLSEAQKSEARGGAEQTALSLLSPWMRGFLAYDPRPALGSLTVPTLSLIGTKDLQVPAEPNQAAIRKAMGSRAEALLSAQTLPGLNHLFQHGATGLPSEYGSIEESFAPEALKVLGDWILSPGVAGKAGRP